MGFFSWITQDTNKSIPSRHSSKKTFPVTMSDDKGNRWHEPHYEGYGEFGGKNYYQLVAEMNRPDQCTGDDRDIGIRLAFGITAIENIDTGKIFKAQGIDFFNWKDDILVDGLSANELLETKKWKQIKISEPGVKFPMLTEDPNVTWKYVGEPLHCEHQGYFYDY